MGRGLSGKKRSASRTYVPGTKRLRSTSSPKHPLFQKLKAIKNGSGDALLPEEHDILAAEETAGRLDKDNVATDASLMNKYTSAAKIASDAAAFLRRNAVVGASVAKLCTSVDEFIADAADAVFKSSKGDTTLAGATIGLPRGVAHPTTVSANRMVMNFAPTEYKESTTAVMLSDDTKEHLYSGDVVRAETSCHIDGYIATVVNTFLVEAVGGTTTPDAGQDANMAGVVGSAISSVPSHVAAVLQASHELVQTLARAFRPGAPVSSFAAIVDSICSTFDLDCLAGSAARRCSRGGEAPPTSYVGGGPTAPGLFGVDTVRLHLPEDRSVDKDRKTDADAVKAAKVEVGQVWTIDLLLGRRQGDGDKASKRKRRVLHEEAQKATIFAPAEVSVWPKSRAASSVVGWLRKNRPGFTMPFHVRWLVNAMVAAAAKQSEEEGEETQAAVDTPLSSYEAKARLGLRELMRAGAVDPVPPLYSPDPHTAISRCKVTIAVLPKRNKVLTPLIQCSPDVNACSPLGGTAATKIPSLFSAAIADAGVSSGPLDGPRGLSEAGAEAPVSRKERRHVTVLRRRSRGGDTVMSS